MSYRARIFMTYYPGVSVNSESAAKAQKLYVKSLSADGSFSVCHRAERARVFRTPQMADKALDHVRTAFAGIKVEQRPATAVEVLYERS